MCITFCGVTVSIIDIYIATFAGILSLFVMYFGFKHRLVDSVIFGMFVTNIGLVLSVTLMNRSPYIVRRAAWSLFWSYKNVINGVNSTDFFFEILLNIILFIPTGILVCLALRHMITSYRLFVPILFGFMFSGMIESAQLLLKLGFFEWDDMVGNTFGTFLGVCIGMCLYGYRRRYLHDIVPIV